MYTEYIYSTCNITYISYYMRYIVYLFYIWTLYHSCEMYLFTWYHDINRLVNSYDECGNFSISPHAFELVRIVN